VSELKPWVKYEEIKNNGGRFTVEPLERGMGVTLGNSLRRVLLSSLTGLSVTALKIDGIQHEFTGIPNVAEDVLDVVASLKTLVLKGTTDEPKTLKIDKKGKGKVTAKDIQGIGELEIINKDLEIAEITGKGSLNIEMIVENGIGYAASENRPDRELPIDWIEIDSSHSPVLKVDHKVEKVRVGTSLNFDSLKIDVWTDGSINPDQAVQDASNILSGKFGLFQKLNEEPAKEVETSESKSSNDSEAALSLTIDDLELSARSSNCLKRAGIETVSELVKKDMSELIQIKNFGKKSADEINGKLVQFGLALKEDV